MSRQQMQLAKYSGAVEKRLKDWQGENFSARLYDKDFSLWAKEPVAELTDRLGWLGLPEAIQSQVEELKAFGEETVKSGIKRVILLGMGGSSLAPEVLQRTYGERSGYPVLTVLDSTHPAAVQGLAKTLDLPKTLFVVSSKSGTTTETLSFFNFFYQAVGEVSVTPGDHFVAITDPGSSLEKLATERKFRRIFYGLPEVGGRYSALSSFGLVPAALIGIDLESLAGAAAGFAKCCAPEVKVADNPALQLGAAMGELAISGRDKLVLFTSPGLTSLPDWIEQLVAESTGKQGRGIVPLPAAGNLSLEAYGDDAFFVYLGLAGEENDQSQKLLTELKDGDRPHCHIQLENKDELGAEFFRWELATAAAGSVLGVNPFDQPDVQLAKALAKEAMSAAPSGAGKAELKDAQGETVGDSDTKWADQLRSWLKPKTGDYLCIQAFLEPSLETAGSLAKLSQSLAKLQKLPTVIAFGPRFLHSNGQLHKGGADNGLYLQLIDQPNLVLPVPETDYTFQRLVRAQADGDLQALKQRGRRILRLNLGSSVASGLAALKKALT